MKRDKFLCVNVEISRSEKKTYGEIRRERYQRGEINILDQAGLLFISASIYTQNLVDCNIEMLIRIYYIIFCLISFARDYNLPYIERHSFSQNEGKIVGKLMVFRKQSGFDGVDYIACK